MERLVSDFHMLKGNLSRQMRVEGVQQFPNGMRPSQGKGNHLSRGVDSCICASGCQNRVLLPTEFTKGSFDLTLNGAGIRLFLESGKICAVVGKYRFVKYELRCHIAEIGGSETDGLETLGSETGDYSTSSIRTISAASPMRGVSLITRV